MARFLALLLLVGGLLTIATSPAQACSCVVGTPDQGIRKSDVVFQGVVDRIEDGPRRLVFDIEHIWKGHPHEGVAVRTGMGGGDCGLGGEVGDRIFIVAYKDDVNTLQANICFGYGATRSDADRILGPGYGPPVNSLLPPEAPPPVLGGGALSVAVQILLSWFGLA